MAAMNQKFRVLITGGSGFLGKSLRASFANECQVLNVDRTGQEGAFALDLLKLEEWEKLNDFASYPLVFLINLAFAFSPERDMEEINTLLVQNLGMFLKKHPHIFLFYPSTALLYGLKYRDVITEEFLPSPKSRYAMLKQKIENMLLSDFSQRCVIFRITNVYGRRMSDKTVVGKIVYQLEQDKRISLFDYNSVRDFIYIDDVVEAFKRMTLCLTDRHTDAKGSLRPFGDESPIFNLSTGKGIAIYDLASALTQYYQKPYLLPERETVIDHGYQEHLVLSPQKLRDWLCAQQAFCEVKTWSPISITEGIERMLSSVNEKAKDRHIYGKSS
ncbi:MAG: NAD(P)-dependent oxidoreductase [Candidatus Omnitrophota bacterium]|nr:MAG: NAD(P)-dependent oxidoreductase [Candidatus Omnitrophota bacterium]